MPRLSNTTERRAQIVRGLEQVMAACGYERASIQAIAEAAGLAPGLVHYHFKNKQEILIELVRSLGERLERRRQDAAEHAGTDAVGRLRAWLDAHVALGRGADSIAVACWVAIGAEAIRLPEVRSVYAEALLREREQLEELLKAAAAPARLSPARRKQYAAGLLATIQGAYLLGTAATETVPPGFAQPALRTHLDGLLKELKK